MRILHIVQSLDMGGQERMILHLSRALIERGHEVHVATLSPGGALRSQFEGIPVVEIVRRPGFDPRAWMSIVSLIRQLRPDAVHTHNPSPMFLGVPAAKILRVAHIVHTKHGANIYGPRSLPASRVVARMTTAFVAVSEGTAEVARTKERVPEERLHVIPNGIPLSSFAPNAETRARVRRELGIPADAYVVGSVGRLAVEKDYPLLVRAVAPMLGERVRLVLAGDGAARAEIEAAIPVGSREFVVLTGVRHDVGDLLTAFDVFSLTSKTEGLPLAIPEAMASGLPVVATAVGGLPSIVPQSVGMLAPHGDAEGLRRAFEELRDDAERRGAMGRAAREHAWACFSLETMVNRYEALYRNRGKATYERTQASIQNGTPSPRPSPRPCSPSTFTPPAT
jgi:glycosyltransferase involved in cell wall biosynthesis